MTEKETLEERLSNIEKELKSVKEKIAQEEHNKWIEEWYNSQKGNGGPPMPHF